MKVAISGISRIKRLLVVIIYHVLDIACNVCICVPRDLMDRYSPPICLFWFSCYTLFPILHYLLNADVCVCVCVHTRACLCECARERERDRTKKWGTTISLLIIIFKTLLPVDGIMECYGCCSQFLVNRALWIIGIWISHFTVPEVSPITFLFCPWSYSSHTIPDVIDKNNQHIFITLVISCKFTMGQTLGWTLNKEVDIVKARHMWQ